MTGIWGGASGSTVLASQASGPRTYVEGKYCGMCLQLRAMGDRERILETLHWPVTWQSPVSRGDREHRGRHAVKLCPATMPPPLVHAFMRVHNM